MRIPLAAARLLLAVFFLLPVAVQAQEPPEGTKEPVQCFVVENVEEFPAHHLVAYFERDDYAVAEVIEGERYCAGLGFYEQADATVYAVPRDLLDEERLRDEPESFLRETPGVIPSGVRIPATGFLVENDPIIYVTDVLRVERLEPDAFDLRFEHVEYRYWDNQTLELPYEIQGQRPPSPRPPEHPIFSLRSMVGSLEVLGLAGLCCLGILVLMLITAIAYVRRRPRRAAPID